MRVRHDGGQVLIETDTYRLEIDAAQPIARLADANGAPVMRLSLLAALDSDRGLDGTVTHGPPRVERTADGCEVTFAATSTAWDAKEIRLRCSTDEIAFTASVTGTGRLTSVRLLGGPYTGNPRWGGGTFHSQWIARSLFSPSPDDPKRILQPAGEAGTIGVVGSAQPGRGHWFFTPAPFLFAGTAAVATHPDDAAAAPWTTLELRCGVEAALFSELRYSPTQGGFSLELAYEGATTVDGAFTTPLLVIRTGVASPYEALRAHGERLRADGSAPRVTRATTAWWTRPIFCGWGEQCRQAKFDGEHPASASRRELYDAWLATLAGHGVTPGTIVIDDKWQTTYGRNEPDPDRWPDMRGWIADRHAAGQRVLLWFKAWDAEGLPPEACITDPLGDAVAADPTSPEYEAILRASLGHLLGPDGLDADGLKVDFTAQTPSGPGLRRRGDAWGVALLHRLLSLVHRSAKEAKPDALIVTHAPSPLFADVTDMLRLNDLMRLDDLDPFAPAVAQMTHRARVAAAVDPGLLIDTDDWCMPSKAEWRAYLAAKPSLGVPALYYATGIDHSGEAFDDDDYAAIRDAWARWELVRDD
ncbi:MAG TPA: hypothetical protein VF364_00570 [Candidatus Limnocylindria bacterium]